MVEKKKRGLVIGILIVVLAAAVYLNWQFAPGESFEPKLSEVTADNELGTAMLVSAGGDQNVTISDSDVVAASKSNDYFEQMISEREKARKDSIAILEDIINDATKSGADKNDAVTQTATIARQIKVENSIESLVKAKGFTQCFAIVSDTQVTVIVSPEEELNSAKISIIKDIIISQTNMPASCISISQAKIN